MKKLMCQELTNDEKEQCEQNLNSLKAKMRPEDIQWAIMHSKDLNCLNREVRMPHSLFKAKRVLKQLIMEPSMSPDEKKSLEEKLQ